MMKWDDKVSECFLEKILPHCESKVLDMGCGNGSFSKLLIDRGLQVIGIDRDADKIATAERENPKGIFISTTFEEYTTDVRYETVVAKNVLEHFTPDESQRLVKRIYTWMYPDSKVLVYVPNTMGLHRRLGKCMGLSKSYGELTESDMMMGHKQLYTKERLIREFRNAKFGIIDCKGLLVKPFPSAFMDLLGTDIYDGLYSLVKEDETLEPYCSGFYLIAVK